MSQFSPKLDPPSEHLLMRTLAGSIPDQIYFKDLHSRFVWINQAMAERFQLGDAKEAIGKTDFDFFAPEHAQQALADEQAVLRTGQALRAREEKETWPDGRVTWVSTTKECWRDENGNIIGTFGISRDITPYKTAESQLGQKTEFLDSLIQHLPVAVFVKNVQNDFRFEFWNNKACELFGFEKSYVRGKNDHDLYASEVADLFRRDDVKTIEEGRVVDIPSEAFVSPKAGRRFLHTIKVPIFGQEGRPLYLLGISEDITEKKEAEENLQKTAAELARSNSELEQFAYIASHDLQEPLRMIASFTQLLARRYKEQLDKEAHEFISYAVEGATRMQSLINDLLAYSRVGTRPKPFVTISSSLALKQAMENLTLAIQENDAKVTWGNLPDVACDPTQLTLLFQNLLSNAIKFKQPGFPPAIHIEAQCQSESGCPPEWTFAVRDNGIGIEPQYFQRIFVIFQRLHTRDQYAGSGIGLAVCKKIVERHGGRIWLESSPGKGSTFYFTLPMMAPAHHERAGNPNSSS